jgi:iron complex outermembrane receptor protein
MAAFSRAITVIAAFLLHLAVSAQEPMADTLKEVVVTGISTTGASYTSQNIESISIKEMQQQGAMNLADALAKSPGISQMTTGISIAKPVIRGLYGNRILVLLSGLRFDNQQWQDEHGMGLSYIGIDRTEVIRGPASVLYGTDALGGVINIIEEKPDTGDHHSFDINTRFFSNTLGTLTDAGYMNRNGNKWSRLRVGFESHGDYSDGNNNRVLNSRNSGYYLKTGMGFLKGRWRSENTYNFSLNNYGFIMEDLHDFFDPDARWSRSMAGPHHIVLLNIGGSNNTLYLDKSVLNIHTGVQSNLRMEDEGGGQISLNMHLVSLLNTLKWEKQLGQRTLFIASNQLTSENNTNYGARIIVPDANLMEASGSVFIRHYFKKLVMEAGAGVSDKYIRTFETARLNSPDKEMHPFARNHVSVNGIAGFSLNPTEELNIKSNISTGFRAPNLAELSSNGLHEGIFHYEIGDPDLKIEQNINIDLTMEGEKEWCFASLSGFGNRFFNYIYLAPVPEEFFGFPIYRFKQQDALLYGGEAIFNLNLPSAKWLQWKNSGSIIYGKLDDGNNLPFIPATKITTAFHLQKEKAGRAAQLYIEPEYQYVFRQDRPAKYETTTPAYSLVNLGAGMLLPVKSTTLDISISCHNLLNEAYADHLSRLKDFGILNPGRNVMVHVRIPLKK